MPATRARRSAWRTSWPAGASSFVAGHFCSGSSIPARDVYAEEGVLQISPASTNPRFTDEGKWNTFRVCGRDDQQGRVAGAYILQNFRGKRVAILHDNSAYGKGLADETKKALNAGGTQETMYAAYTPGERDYNALVSRMKAANIDVIYIGGYHTEAGLIIRQAREQGMNVTLIGGDALVTNEFWQISGAAGEGTLMTFSSDPRKRPDGGAGGGPLPRPQRRSRGLCPLHLCRDPDLRRGREEDERHRSAPHRRGAEGGGAVGDGARPDLLRRQGRCHGARLRLLHLAQRVLRRDLVISFAPTRRVGAASSRQQPKGGDPVSHRINRAVAPVARITAG